MAVVGLVVGSVVVAATYVSIVIFERQAHLDNVSRYNLSWSAGQAVGELTRLETAIASAGNPAIEDEDAVELRYEIFENRLAILSGGAFEAFVAADPARLAAMNAVRTTLTAVRPLLASVNQPKVAARALGMLETLNPLLIGLASDANRTTGDAVSSDEAELLRLHWQFTELIAGLIVSATCLLVVVFRNHRLLRRAYSVLESTTEQLHRTSISRGTLDRALTNMSQGLCMFDPNDRLVFINRRFCEILGLSVDIASPGTNSDALLKTVRDRGGRGSLTDQLLTAHLEIAAAGRQVSFESSEGGTTIAVCHEPLGDGGWLATYEDVTQRKQIEAKIAHMASHDDLTGLANRMLFRKELQNSLSRLGPQSHVAIVCLDLDHFKKVNDSLGHPIGDELLRAVAGRIYGCIRSGDTLARLGGDEFAIVQNAQSQPEAAQELAARLTEVLGEPFKLQEHQVVIGASVGIAAAPRHSSDPDVLLMQADLALYQAKSDGRSTWRVFETEMDAKMQTRRALEADLRRAIVEREFTIFYQPLVNARDHKISGFEALLRWIHPTRGVVMPSDFIGLAEEMGAIDAIGAQVLEQACLDAANWPDNLSVAVNISPIQFRSGDIVAITRDALNRSGFPPHRLQLEITETVLLCDTEAVIATLQRLRALGVLISMDDFGTGYSSLSYLRKFPFDKIKIDRSFVSGLGSDPESDAIVSAIVSLSESLGIQTTVEGVETVDQLAWIESKGALEVQGFLFGKPAPLCETEKLIDRKVTRIQLSSDMPANDGHSVIPITSRIGLGRRRTLTSSRSG